MKITALSGFWACREQCATDSEYALALEMLVSEETGLPAVLSGSFTAKGLAL